MTATRRPEPRDDSADSADGARAADGAGVARNSAVMVAGSLASRATGLVRNAVLVAAVGGSVVANAYTVSNTLPNMVYELLVGGVLASVLVPLMVRAQVTDDDRGEAYAQRLLTLALVSLGGATVLAVAAAPYLSGAFSSSSSSPGSEHLRTVLAYLLLPEIFFYGVAAIIAAILNTRGFFAAPMWTPILNNVVVIAACAVFMLLPSPNDRTTGPLTRAQLLVLGLGTTLGIVVQAAGLLPALRRAGFRWRLRWDFRRLRLRELGRLSAWMLFYVVMSQVGVTVIVKLAQLAADTGGVGPIVFNNSFLVFMMAHGVIAVSVITALMPRMSAAAQEGRPADLARLLSSGTRLCGVLLIPVTAVCLVLGGPIAVVLFQYGAYDADIAGETGTAIAVAATGLVPFAISQVQLFAFYAMSDTKTPALINVLVVAVRVAVDVALFVAAPPALVVSGLMAGNAISFVVCTGVGYWLLRRRIGGLGLSSQALELGKMCVAAVVAALAAWLVAGLLLGGQAGGWSGGWAGGRAGGWAEGWAGSWGSSALRLAGGATALLVVYLLMAMLLRIQALRGVRELLARAR